MIEIAYLADRPETIPTLTDWFLAQWPDYYAGTSPAELAQDFWEDARREGIPLRLVAFADGEPAGTIILREEAISSLPGYTPGLGGLLVAERYRGRGIGSELVRAGMNIAREQGYERVYATTHAARGILERLGWTLVKAFRHEDEELMLFCREL
jgi:predicted N-acetyltransferase YhbS